MLQEPTFQDVIMLYRLKSPAPTPTDPTPKVNRNVYITILRDIPMADLEVIFPEKTVGLRPMEILKFSITACLGIISVILNLETDSSFLGYTSLIGFLLLSAKSGWDWYCTVYYYESLIIRMLFEKFSDTHIGSIHNLVSQVKGQEMKEALLAYIFLVLEGPQSERDLDSKVEKFFTDLQADATHVDFECNDALAKLEEFGIVHQSNGVYSAVPVQDAVKKLDSIWISSVSK